MARKKHFNPNTGIMEYCSAKEGNCPFGGHHLPEGAEADRYADMRNELEVELEKGNITKKELNDKLEIEFGEIKGKKIKDRFKNPKEQKRIMKEYDIDQKTMDLLLEDESDYKTYGDLPKNYNEAKEESIKVLIETIKNHPEGITENELHPKVWEVGEKYGLSDDDKIRMIDKVFFVSNDYVTEETVHSDDMLERVCKPEKRKDISNDKNLTNDRFNNFKEQKSYN